ncbi:sulfurtransferase TusA family protein [Phytoactinopolyspora endophytica]|uniref:sulfurtransferase TusA family protein n=1 Tax=Phytoactinopolyspora endophytica TaxID=1642495 RepID=UPI00101D0B34|nr:sulfurtransferase TusA family protein [Phytoactinopolyspora endophytica]
MIELELDCRGQLCPLPVIELAKRIGDAPIGGLVRIIADDPAAATDIPAWCRMRGQEYAGPGEAEASAPSYLVRRIR